MKRILDLRSDTITRPTDKMRDAMRNAEVGDVVLGDDPTVAKLEEMGAELFGKEACIFTASGTMSNQAAVLAMTKKGEQVIVHKNAHIYNLELAALSQICGVQARSVKVEDDGRFDLEDLKANLITAQIQTSPTSLICMENTFDLNQGLIIDKQHIDEVCAIAHENNVAVYMDGARILNAAVALDMPAKDLCENLDAVALCLTKGLGCPIGSLLAGPKEMIEEAKRMRQMLGGGWRQAGIVAAAGIVALSDFSFLKDDHEKAQILAKGLKEIGLGIDMKQVQTNVVKIDVAPVNLEALEFCDLLDKEGIKAKPVGKTHVRMICHLDVSFEDIETVLQTVKKVVK